MIKAVCRVATRTATSIVWLGLLSLLLSGTAHAQASCTRAAPTAATTSSLTGTFRVYAYGVSNAASVIFPTWGASGGQNDLVWYTGVNAGNGTWYADINLANHNAGNPEYGQFNTHVYATTANGTSTLCAATTWSRVAATPTCTSAAPSSATTTKTSGTFRVYAYGVANAASMLFPTWGEDGGQNDLVWYPGVNAGNGTWFADVNLANHKTGNPEYGKFNTHVYVTPASGSSTLCAATTWSRAQATDVTPPTVSISNPVNGAVLSGTVTVTASATDNIGVSRVEFYGNGKLIKSVAVAPYSFSLDTTQMANGSLVLTAKAYDAAGNVGSKATSVAITNYRSCSLPWGGTLSSGTSVKAFAAPKSPVCASETRTCTDGTLGGSYA